MTIGQVFTPPALAGEVLDRVKARPARILDPACGTGNFLVEAARRWPGAELTGLETDPAAAAVARGRLADAIARGLAAPGSRIVLGDALSAEVRPEYDLVCGNPPYAAAHRDPGDRHQARKTHETARGSFDMAVPFVERSARWLAPGGWLALVVSNKILVKDYAAKLRAWLDRSVAVREVWDLASWPVFEHVQIDAAVLLAERAERGPVRIVLADRRGGYCEYTMAQLPATRWEVYKTPEVARIMARLAGPAIGEWPGVVVRDGVQGRDYHRVPILDGDLGGWPVVSVGRIERGRIAWDRPLKRGGRVYRDPRIQAAGSLGAFCQRPKILVRGVCRRLTCAYVPEAAVPLTAVRAIAVDPDRAPALVDWLHSDLASWRLQVECRSDRIPGGSFNVSKRWLEALPVPAALPDLSEAESAAIAQWQAAFGI